MYVLYDDQCLWYIGILHNNSFGHSFRPKSDPCKYPQNAERVRLMPVCVLSDVTTGHPESMAKICILNMHSTKCVISNSSMLLLLLALRTWGYTAKCIIILIQAIGVFFPLALHDIKLTLANMLYGILYPHPPRR